MSIYQQIRDAWANVDPLSKVLPFDDDEFLDGEPFEDDVAAYLALAANHADKMAERLAKVEAAIEELEAALKARKHGGVAAWDCIHKIKAAMLSEQP